MASDEKKPFKVKVSVEVERVIVNYGASRRLTIALKMFKDIVIKCSCVADL